MANVFRQVDAVFKSFDEAMKQVFGPDLRPRMTTSAGIRITLGKEQLIALHKGKTVIYRAEDIEIKIEGDPCRT